jgi:myo-inositol 2-dehydrogenase/D-chiro-inositol 1-dehydrogenase
MRWIAGEIVEVSAYGARRSLPEDVPWHDTIITSLKFASGAVGKCLVSCGAKVPYAMNLSYYGTKGTVINDKLFLDGIPHVETFMQLPVAIRAEDHTCAEELDHFLDCIETGATPLIDAADGARSVAVCCAVAESIDTGQPAAVQLEF